MRAPATTRSARDLPAHRRIRTHPQGITWLLTLTRHKQPRRTPAPALAAPPVKVRRRIPFLTLCGSEALTLRGSGAGLPPPLFAYEEHGEDGPHTDVVRESKSAEYELEIRSIGTNA